MKPWAQLARDVRAAAALEFAIVGTVVVILLIAIFDIGLVFMAQRSLDYGIAKAVRWAAVNGAAASPPTVLTQFQATTSALLPGSGDCKAFSPGASIPASTTCSVTVSLSNGSVVGSIVTVQASYRWTPFEAITGFSVITLRSGVALAIQH